MYNYLTKGGSEYNYDLTKGGSEYNYDVKIRETRTKQCIIPKLSLSSYPTISQDLEPIS